MKTRHRLCKTNCLHRTQPDDRGRQRGRLRCELGRANQGRRCPGKALVARTTESVVRGFSVQARKSRRPKEQVCAARARTSEAIKYMKTRHRLCKTNCRRRTVPEDQGRQRGRLRCELGRANQGRRCPGKALVARTTESVVRGFSVQARKNRRPKEQVCAARARTSEAIKYMKTRHRLCKTNCRRRTVPEDQGRRRGRLRCESGRANQGRRCPGKALVARTTASVVRGFSVQARKSRRPWRTGLRYPCFYERSH